MSHQADFIQEELASEKPAPYDYKCIWCKGEFYKGFGVRIDGDFNFCIPCIKKLNHRLFLAVECGLDKDEIRKAIRIRKPL